MLFSIPIKRLILQYDSESPCQNRDRDRKTEPVPLIKNLEPLQDAGAFATSIACMATAVLTGARKLDLRPTRPECGAAPRPQSHAAPGTGPAPAQPMARADGTLTSCSHTSISCSWWSIPSYSNSTFQVLTSN